MAVFLLVIGSAIYTRRYTRSVADFLSANRCAGRYLLTVAGGIASLGAGRLMFASNWPVNERGLSYQTVVAIVAGWAESLAASERDAVWSETAREAYGLSPWTNETAAANTTKVKASR